jgi:hypothetical protein
VLSQHSFSLVESVEALPSVGFTLTRGNAWCPCWKAEMMKLDWTSRQRYKFIVNVTLSLFCDVTIVDAIMGRGTTVKFL